MTEAHNADNGLPVVASQITIQGNGSTITGIPSPSFGDFRILAVGAAGNLTLNNCTITRGNAYYLPGGGGGIANLGGTLTLNSSTVSNNIGWPSGGIYSTEAPSPSPKARSRSTVLVIAAGWKIRAR
ncbi:MAG: hypothetical protein ACREYE_27455 [Gammaproteobacteria bacterium]